MSTESDDTSQLQIAGPPSLLDGVRSTPPEELAKGVKATEKPNGSTVEPIYSARQMRCYSVTESELRQIGLANLGITAFSTIGSACLAFWLDIFKDTVLAESIPEAAQIAISYVEPLLLVFGVGFWIVAGLGVLWRHKMIELIKKESPNP